MTQIERMRGWFTALLAATLGACAPAYTDRDPTEQAALAVSEWDSTVGVLRTGIVLDVVSTTVGDPDGRLQGSCKNRADGATITLFRGSFRADDFEAEVRHVMLHELVHAHLRMDHSSNEADLMFPEITGENRDAGPSAATIAAVRERWLRP